MAQAKAVEARAMEARAMEARAMEARARRLRCWARHSAKATLTRDKKKKGPPGTTRREEREGGKRVAKLKAALRMAGRSCRNPKP